MYPTNVDHQQNIFKIGNPSGEPGKKGKKKKKKKNPMVLNHGNTMGTGLLTAPSRLYLNFFFACGAIFPFLLRKKGFDV